MKRLVSLISTEGKTPEQITQEVWAAWQKYQQVSQKAAAIEKPEQKQEQAQANDSAN